MDFFFQFSTLWWLFQGKGVCLMMVKNSAFWGWICYSTDVFWPCFWGFAGFFQVSLLLGNLLPPTWNDILAGSKSEHPPQSNLQKTEFKLPLTCMQSITCFPFHSFKITDPVSPSVSSRDNFLKSLFFQPTESKASEAFLPQGSRNGCGSLSLMYFTRTFSLISQVPDALAVEP